MSINEHPVPAGGSLPPAQWLRTFLAVVQAGSFSVAAQHLHMTQAAVSRHIRLLEHRLGAALFERHARGVTPTTLAESMLPRVEQAFSLLEAASAEATNQPQVHLRCDITWAEAVLSPRLQAFCISHPHIRLQISTFIWPDAGPVTEADLHVLIGAGELPTLRRIELTRETACVVASPRIAQAFLRRPETVTCLTRIGQESTWRRWSQHHADRPANAPRVICDSSIVTRAAALADQGLALLRESQINSDIISGSLERVDEFVEQLDEGYCLYFRDSAVQSAAVNQVRDWLIEIGGPESFAESS